MVTIPGISGREPKEISFKNLAYIIQSRMEEIIDAVTFEIQNSGYYDKLAAGIVLTGGGALLKHLPQLVKFRTGMDVRVGLPNLHLTGEVDEEINQPMFSTSIGLVLKGFEYLKNNNIVTEENKIEKEVDFEVAGIMDFDNKPEEDASNKRSIFDKFKNTCREIFAENGMKME